MQSTAGGETWTCLSVPRTVFSGLPHTYCSPARPSRPRSPSGGHSGGSGEHTPHWHRRTVWRSRGWGRGWGRGWEGWAGLCCFLRTPQLVTARRCHGYRPHDRHSPQRSSSEPSRQSWWPSQTSLESTQPKDQQANWPCTQSTRGRPSSGGVATSIAANNIKDMKDMKDNPTGTEHWRERTEGGGHLWWWGVQAFQKGTLSGAAQADP